MTDKQPEALRLADFLHYNPSSGMFIWKVKRGQRIKPGYPAGSLDNHGYIKIMVARKMYKAHRLAWFLTHGEWPENQIDHINGNRSDNRIANLRLASNKQNAENRGVRSDNTSGYRGVSFDKKSGMYEASIRHNGKKVCLGFFEKAEEAALKAKKAREQTFSHCDKDYETEIKRLHEVNAELVEALRWLVAAVDADGHSTKYQRGLSKASYALAKATGENNE